MKYFIQTLGCMMNYSDTERVAAILEKMGYEKTDKPNQTDLYIFNTCSIRQKGEDRVFGQLKKIKSWKQANPRLHVGLTGCMVRKTSTKNSPKEDKDDLLRKPLPGVDFVFNIKDAHRLGELISEAEPRLEIDNGELNLSGYEDLGLDDYLKITPKYSSPLIAYVPIQVGCDQYCTYCIVPYARGREQSRPLADIMRECEKLVENGCKEITLGGQIVNSWGQSDLDLKNIERVIPEFSSLPEKFQKEPFVYLLTQVDKLHSKGLNRLRFTSPHPRYFSDALIEAHSQLKTLCPHIHLPIQSGDDQILQKMNRRYKASDYLKIAEKVRATIPNCAFGTDIIVGFCGESEQQFQNTLDLYQKIGWDMCYLARYSERQGTVSQKAFPDDISRQEKASRWHRLNALLEAFALDYHQKMVGHTAEVLVEKYIEETGECEGRSRENKVVQFPGAPEQVGQILPIKITKALQWLVKGESA